jgi:hypothetical protein
VEGRILDQEKGRILNWSEGRILDEGEEGRILDQNNRRYTGQRGREGFGLTGGLGKVLA